MREVDWIPAFLRSQASLASGAGTTQAGSARAKALMEAVNSPHRVADLTIAIVVIDC
jgi:hypothetical protein